MEEKTGFYEARELGGSMMMLFDRHDTFEACRDSFVKAKNEGKVRHCIVQVVPLSYRPPVGVSLTLSQEELDALLRLALIGKGAIEAQAFVSQVEDETLSKLQQINATSD